MCRCLEDLVCIGVLCAAAPCGLAQTLTTGGPPAKIQVAVDVYNYAGVPPATLARAEREARRILQKAGIQTEWFDAPTGKEAPSITLCEDARGPSHVILRILPQSVMRGVDSQNDSFGLAFPGEDEDPGSCAYIFYDRLRELAVRIDIKQTVLLAYFSAHEIGHLLLGLNSHSSAGLMRGKWSKKDLENAALGQLAFTTAESERMRSAVLARNRKGSRIVVTANK